MIEDRAYDNDVWRGSQTTAITSLSDDAFQIVASFLEVSDWISFGCASSECQKISENVILKIQKYGYLCAREIATAWYVGEQQDAEELATYFFHHRGLPIYPPCHGFTLATLFWRMRMEERAQMTDPSSNYLQVDDKGSRNDKEYHPFTQQRQPQKKLETHQYTSSRARIDFLLTHRKQWSIFENVQFACDLLEHAMLQSGPVSYLEQKISFWKEAQSFLGKDSTFTEEWTADPLAISCHSFLINQHVQGEKPFLSNGCVHALRSFPKSSHTNHPSNCPEALTRTRLRASGLLPQQKRAISLNTDITYKSCERKRYDSSCRKGSGTSVLTESDVEGKAPRFNVSARISAQRRKVSPRVPSDESQSFRMALDQHVLDESSDDVSMISYNYASVQLPHEMEQKVAFIEKKVIDCSKHTTFNECLYELWDCFFPSTSSVSFFNGRAAMTRDKQQVFTATSRDS